MTSAASFGFWQPRRTVRIVDSSTRCRPRRLKTSAILHPPKSSVNFQVETFRLFGKLRKTTTEIHNSLPSIDTIETEKTLMSFEEKRRGSPDSANYDEFYRCLSTSVTPSPSRMNTTRSARASSRSLDARQPTFFSLVPGPAPPPSSLSARTVDSRQSILSRLGSCYSLRPLDTRQSERPSLSAPKSFTSSKTPSTFNSKLTETGTMESEIKASTVVHLPRV